MTMPEGYTEVREGNVLRSDLVWNPSEKVWQHPKAAPYRPLGTVKEWWCVIRKAA